MNVATEERHEEEAVRPGSGTARLGGTDIFRGALVIITAIVIGGFVISRGLDGGTTEDLSASETEAADPASPGDEEGDADTAGADADGGVDGSGQLEQATVSTPGVTAAPDVTDTTVAAMEEETEVEETVPAAPAARTPAEVKVLVLNGAQTQGIAARGTEALKAASYITAAPKNANTQQPSVILYQEGYELDAIAVAGVFTAGLEAIVQPMDPSALPIDDTQGSNVIVVIGSDSVIPIP
jgi:hypothetical protein